MIRVTGGRVTSVLTGDLRATTRTTVSATELAAPTA